MMVGVRVVAAGKLLPTLNSNKKAYPSYRVGLFVGVK
jgi:hypothetical protein